MLNIKIYRVLGVRGVCGNCVDGAEVETLLRATSWASVSDETCARREPPGWTNVISIGSLDARGST